MNGEIKIEVSLGGNYGRSFLWFLNGVGRIVPLEVIQHLELRELEPGRPHTLTLRLREETR